MFLCQITRRYRLVALATVKVAVATSYSVIQLQSIILTHIRAVWFNLFCLFVVVCMFAVIVFAG